MANLTEVSQWESVIRQIENGEAATGGADGLANIQAKQLANRTKYLKDNYLPLAGGAVSGNITKSNNETQLVLLGANALGLGASLSLHGGSMPEREGEEGYAGGFLLSTGKGVPGTYKYLQGSPDGRLTWGSGGINEGGNDLAGAVIAAKSLGKNGYVKYASGLIIQWFNSGTITIEANTNGPSIETTSPIAVTTPLFCMGSIGQVNNTAKLFLRNVEYIDGHTVHHQCMNIENVETKYIVNYLFIGVA